MKWYIRPERMSFAALREEALSKFKPKKIRLGGFIFCVYKDEKPSRSKPRCPYKGVYMITKKGLGKKRTILYVGSCASFIARLSGHSKLPKCRLCLEKGEVIEILFFKTDDNRIIERTLIKKYSPIFNIVSNYEKRGSAFIYINGFLYKKVG